MVLALARLRAAVAGLLGEGVGRALMLLTALQFHLPFYASRPLPNTFAVALASLAHADWISGRRPERAIVLMAIAVVLLQAEPACINGSPNPSSHRVPFEPGMIHDLCISPMCGSVRCPSSSGVRRGMLPSGSHKVRLAAMGWTDGPAHAASKTYQLEKGALCGGSLCSRQSCTDCHGGLGILGALALA